MGPGTTHTVFVRLYSHALAFCPARVWCATPPPPHTHTEMLVSCSDLTGAPPGPAILMQSRPAWFSVGSDIKPPRSCASTMSGVKSGGSSLTGALPALLNSHVKLPCALLRTCNAGAACGVQRRVVLLIHKRLMTKSSLTACGGGGGQLQMHPLFTAYYLLLTAN